MDAASFVKLAILLSVFAIVVAIGMRARPSDVLAFARYPRYAVRATLAMFVVMPLFVILITWALPLAPPLPAALIALAVSPMPPILPRKEAKTGGEMDYVISLQVFATVISLIAAPLFIAVAGWLFDVKVAYSPGNVFMTLLLTVAIPLAAGIAVRRFWPAVADRLADPLGQFGMVALIVAGLGLLVAVGPVMVEKIGSGVLLTAILIVVVALGVGHALGGPSEGNRGALAVATAARHPGVAIGMGTTYYPLDQGAVIAVVLIYVLISILISIPYVQWRRRVMAARAAGL